MTNPAPKSNCENEVVIPFSSLPKYDQALIKQNAEKYGNPVPTEVYVCNDLNTEGLVKVSQPAAINGVQKNSAERINTLRDLRRKAIGQSQDARTTPVTQNTGSFLDFDFFNVVFAIWVIILLFRLWGRIKNGVVIKKLKVNNPENDLES